MSMADVIRERDRRRHLKLETAAGEPLLKLRDLKMRYVVRGRFGTTSHVQALDGVSFDIAPGETLALVGESGCGKSTTGRIIVGLVKATGGSCLYRGIDLTACSRGMVRQIRQEVQFVFQDPISSLNPKMTVHDIIAEPLRVNRLYKPLGGREYVLDLLDQTGLPRRAAERYSVEFSGGQRQRIGIARALALNPRLVVLDEPVSALDVSIQGQIMNLLIDLQRDRNLSYLFISHDLAVVRGIATRVAVMYRGRIVEIGPAETVVGQPTHPYTKALIAAIPGHRASLDVPEVRPGIDSIEPAEDAEGCGFRARCWQDEKSCETGPMPLMAERDGRLHACKPEHVRHGSAVASNPKE